MCGILAIIGKGIDVSLVQEMSKRMSHRGPDESAIHLTAMGHFLAHERLSIIDLHTGIQPIQGTNDAWMIHNGEVYNHQKLRTEVLKNHAFRTTSDSEVIVHLYEEFGTSFCHLLDGMFAFVVVDGNQVMAARDPLGIKPLYYGLDERGRIYFASEMKAIVDICVTISTFPPGHYYTPESGFVSYYKPNWQNTDTVVSPVDYARLREVLSQSVKKRLMSDVPVGVLLSGGLDSSLIAAIAARLMHESGRKLHSFSIGLNAQAPDAIAAQKVADFIGTIHHEIHFTIEEGIQILHQLIWHLETYDVTSIRASTPMYFLSKAIAQLGIKVVLSGEGADEVFGGYLYFRNAPSVADFHKETIERVQKLHTADLLRADKSTMAHGLEARVPFLDQDFLSVAMGIQPADKMPDTFNGIEKFVLRKAFDTTETPYLPQEVLWRQKEQFSDGVGYDWIEALISHATSQVTDVEMESAIEFFPYNTPTSKEAYFYRKIFHQHFPQKQAALTVRKWIPKWQTNTDPSGRANQAHVQTTEASILTV
jgi:asparagine synthase (glutamine-hydrolysing)